MDTSKIIILSILFGNTTLTTLRAVLGDGEHGGTVFIPSRIVNPSKDWDY